MKAPRSPSPAPVRSVALAVALMLAGMVPAGSLGRAGEVRFDRDIRPILAEHCLECHGLDAGSRQGDLRLDTDEGAKPQAVLPGRPDESELVRRILATDPDLRMPPPAKGPGLTATEIDTLRRWIAAGAPYEGHWAFAPIRRPPVPATNRPASTDIDRFLASAREARGLAEPPPDRSA